MPNPLATSREDGYSLVEMLAVLALLGLLVGMAAMYLAPAEAPLATSEDLIEGFVRLARSRAISNTSACRISAASPTRLVIATADTCLDAVWESDDSSDLTLPSDVELTDTAWTVCFTPRGISMNNLIIPFEHPEYGSSGVEVLLGGGARVVP